ncbi:contact-dependent growth inhibition system immunity protein [Paraburkholderia sp. UCT2]|uniref:contact-dependent growth inhibition system immunity protein n=1 Tax=Paraburkholderia sp. UCT2 TaxID=2615208 RepID=UPI00223C451D|nr:contact-dependent growth inhibition system immunity protein [Paraburkholderia sp. UCT2]
MKNQSTYPELGHFFGAYLNQDYDLSGDTLAEVVECYKQGTPVDAHERMRCPR